VLLITFSNTGKANAISITDNMKSVIKNPYEAPTNSQEEIYQDILYSILTPYIQNEVDNYYREILTVSPIVDPISIKILSMERPNGDKTFYFIIEMQVMPYIEAHNSVGIDNITISVDGIGEIKVLKFQHIKDYLKPPN
jgi:hypothetical protein